MIAPVAVFGIGNRSRGDDAAGPELLDRLRDWLAARELAGRFALFEEYQLQVENALDLEGRSLALFIDARESLEKGIDFRRLQPAATALSCFSHSLEPADVLAVHREVTGREPPAAFALGVRASRFGLGEPIGPEARRAMDEAWRLLETVVRDPRLESWQSAARECLPQEEPWQPARPQPAVRSDP